MGCENSGWQNQVYKKKGVFHTGKAVQTIVIAS